MKKAAISFRVEPAIKAAIEQAAKKDARSVASLIDKLLKDYLKKKGALK